MRCRAIEANWQFSAVHTMSNLQFNNSQCVLQECGPGAYLSNDNPISKLATDDYLSELDPDHHLISLNLNNNNHNFVKPLSQMDQQQADAHPTSPQSNLQTSLPNNLQSNLQSNPQSNSPSNSQSNTQSNSQHFPGESVSGPHNRPILNQTNSHSTNQPNSNFQTNQPNQTANQSINQIKRTNHDGSPPPTQNDSDEEMFEEADNSTDESDASNAAGTRPAKSDCLDIETMRTHLVKLKLSKDLSSSPTVDSPLSGDPNEDADFTFFDAIDDYEEENERGQMIRSTSLKTGKAKSLGPKKTLRFADALGECCGDKWPIRGALSESPQEYAHTSHRICTFDAKHTLLTLSAILSPQDSIWRKWKTSHKKTYRTYRPAHFAIWRCVNAKWKRSSSTTSSPVRRFVPATCRAIAHRWQAVCSAAAAAAINSIGRHYWAMVSWAPAPIWSTGQFWCPNLCSRSHSTTFSNACAHRRSVWKAAWSVQSATIWASIALFAYWTCRSRRWLWCGTRRTTGVPGWTHWPPTYRTRRTAKQTSSPWSSTLSRWRKVNALSLRSSTWWTPKSTGIITWESTIVCSTRPRSVRPNDFLTSNQLLFNCLLILPHSIFLIDEPVKDLLW